MNEFPGNTPLTSADFESSRRGLPIALTLIILVIGAVGIIKLQSKEPKQIPVVSAADFVHGAWEGAAELLIQPRDRPEDRISIEYSFEYAAIPSFGGNETVAKRLKVFKREAQGFLGPMKKQDLLSPHATDMLRPALFEVLERSLFPRARGRLTEFTIRQVRLK
jgi:hypothetical protein